MAKLQLKGSLSGYWLDRARRWDRLYVSGFSFRDIAQRDDVDWLTVRDTLYRLWAQSPVVRDDDAEGLIVLEGGAK